MTDTIPTLVTNRLNLRPPRLDDFPAYRDFMASPRSTGVAGPHDLAAAWAMFCQDRALWSFFGHGALMIDLAESGECIGQVGINHGPLYPEKELGWLLYDGHEGMGLCGGSRNGAAGLGLRYAEASNPRQLCRRRQPPIRRCCGANRRSAGPCRAAPAAIRSGLSP